MGQNRKFWPEESISLRTFTPIVSFQDFLPILGAPRPKITNWSFWPACDQTVLFSSVRPKPGFGPFEVQPWVKFSKFWSGETWDLYANGPESFPPGFFTDFECPRAKNYESVFLSCDQMVLLTGMRPKLGFGHFNRCVTISLSWNFWPMVRLMEGNGPQMKPQLEFS